MTEELNELPADSPQGKPAPVCPVCCVPIEVGEPQVICPSCRTAYHRECWKLNEGCAVFGCAMVRCLAEEEASAAEELSACPHCHELIAAKVRVCPYCGERRDRFSESGQVEAGEASGSSEGEDPPLSSHGREVCRSLVASCVCHWNRFYATVHSRLLLLSRDVLRLSSYLRPYVQMVLRSFGRSLYFYGDFSGRTSRQDFVLTSLVSSLLVWLSLILWDGRGLFWLVVGGLWLPTLSMMVRRLHDIGVSGWYLFAFPLLPLLLLVPPVESEPAGEACEQDVSSCGDTAVGGSDSCVDGETAG